MKRDNPTARRRLDRERNRRNAAAILNPDIRNEESLFSLQWLIVAGLWLAMAIIYITFVTQSDLSPLAQWVTILMPPLALVGIIYVTNLMTATFVTVGLIFLLFTPYTHQLDEIKNVMLRSLPPVLLLFALWRTDLRRFHWRAQSASYLLIGMVFAMVVSLVVNWNHALLGERTLWFQMAAVTFTMVFAWFINSEMELRRVMTFFVILSFISTLIGLFFFAPWDFTGSIAEWMQRSRGRYWSGSAINLMRTLSMSKEIYSTILNSDFYAAYLVMTIWIPLAMFFVEEHPGYKVLGFSTFLLMGICLVFTYSNDSYGSVVLGLLVFGVLSYRHIREWISRRLLITVLLGLLVLGGTVLLLMVPKLAQGWQFKTEAFEGRKVLWGGGFWPWLYGEDFTRTSLDWVSILFGTGPGGYSIYFPLFRRFDFFDNQINNVTTFGHNWYLDVLLEFGLLGLVLFLWFYGRVLYDALRQIFTTQKRTHQLYQIALVAGLVSIALQNFFSPNNRWAVCAVIYWSLFGISMGIHSLDNQPEEDPSRDSDRRVPLAVRYALLAVAVVFALRSIPQAKRYFDSAIDNGTGLVRMEYADNFEGGEKLAQLEIARERFERAIRTNPTFATSYYKLGHVYNQLATLQPEKSDELIEKAVATYERLNEVNPHYSEVHLNLAIMYWEQARRATAGPDGLKLTERAYGEIKEGARQSAKPQTQWMAGSIGRDLATRYGELATAATDKAKREEYQQKKLQILEETKKYYQTITTYEPKLPEQVQDRKRLYNKAQLQLVDLGRQTAKPAESEALLKTMYLEDPDRPEYLGALLGFLDQQGKQKEKIEFLKEAVHGDPMDVMLRRQLARAQLKGNNIPEFEAELRRIEVLAPKDKEALRDLYLVYRQKGEADQAAEYATKLKGIGINAEKLSTATLGAAVITTPALEATTATEALLGEATE